MVLNAECHIILSAYTVIKGSKLAKNEKVYLLNVPAIKFIG